ncbi:cytochrome c [Halioxenophilus sp. WMMB6]|uniref:c-type cytochrome n=1 Tax=Halioxenophilus sp. WMMB6 TaxID=3073815 RepID=UPI00295ED192|nr:cytochrome c [Halioxenophilus sp. WMMB6]
MKKLLLPLLAGATVLAAPVWADNSKDPVKAQVHYRQSLFTLVGAHMGKMGAVMKGKADYNAEAMVASANVLAALSAVADQAFVLESAVQGSEAKKEIWSDKAEFDKRLADFVSATATLAENAGTEAGFKENFSAVGKSCKACHDQFKED